MLENTTFVRKMELIYIHLLSYLQIPNFNFNSNVDTEKKLKLKKN
jgi:hypothetical protein